MGAHVDDSEDDKTMPVVSINLGLSAIFFIGSEKRIDAPAPVLLRSGDVLVLSGKSRLFYHGCVVLHEKVPRPEHCAAASSQCDSFPGADLSDEQGALVDKYLNKHRLNLNVRQVLKHGATKLERCYINN